MGHLDPYTQSPLPSGSLSYGGRLRTIKALSVPMRGHLGLLGAYLLGLGSCGGIHVGGPSNRRSSRPTVVSISQTLLPVVKTRCSGFLNPKA